MARLREKFKLVMFCPIEMVAGSSAPRKIAMFFLASSMIRSV
jgi:uncharacterized protein YbbK (DUF523 family)